MAVEVRRGWLNPNTVSDGAGPNSYTKITGLINRKVALPRGKAWGLLKIPNAVGYFFGGNLYRGGSRLSNTLRTAEPSFSIFHAAPVEVASMLSGNTLYFSGFTVALAVESAILIPLATLALGLGAVALGVAAATPIGWIALGYSLGKRTRARRRVQEPVTSSLEYDPNDVRKGETALTACRRRTDAAAKGKGEAPGMRGSEAFSQPMITVARRELSQIPGLLSLAANKDVAVAGAPSGTRLAAAQEVAIAGAKALTDALPPLELRVGG